MRQQQELVERYRYLQDWYQSVYVEKRVASSGGGTLRVAFPQKYLGNSLAVVVSEEPKATRELSLAKFSGKNHARGETYTRAYWK